MGETALILRTVGADMASYGGFRWPESGPVACDDWDPVPECGHGLHGLLWGEGEGSLLNWDPDARWLVVEVPAESTVDLGGKVKFPSGVVVCCGDREAATRYVAEHGGVGRVIVGGTATAGDRGTATAGYGGTATAGDRGTATAGDRGTATAGDGGIIRLSWWDGERRRESILYVGEDGIEAGVAYRVDDHGRPVRA